MSYLDEAKTILVNSLIEVLKDDSNKFEVDLSNCNAVGALRPDIQVTIENKGIIYFHFVSEKFIKITRMELLEVPPGHLNRGDFVYGSPSTVTIVNERLTNEIKHRYDKCHRYSALNEVNRFLGFLNKEKKCSKPKTSSKKLLNEHQ
jgi:hypothetical protein